MFGFFKRKKETESEKLRNPSPEEQALLERGDKLLERLGNTDYLNNLSALCLTNLHNLHNLELYGHIQTCEKIGATEMVGTLAQIAAWKLEGIDGTEYAVEQFLNLAASSTNEALNYIRENNLPFVIH